MLTVWVNNGDLDTEANGGRLNDFADIMLPIARAVTGKDITKKDILDNLAAISSGNASEQTVKDFFKVIEKDFRYSKHLYSS